MFDRCSLDVQAMFVGCPISHFRFPISHFICLCPFSIVVCPFPIAHVRPGGMRGAIEYGQPLAGLSRVRSTRQIKGRRKQIYLLPREARRCSLRGFRRANPVQPHPTLSNPIFSTVFLAFSICFATFCCMKPILVPSCSSFCYLRPMLLHSCP